MNNSWPPPEDLSMRYLGVKVIGHVLPEGAIERVIRRTRSPLRPYEISTWAVHVWSNGTFTVAALPIDLVMQTGDSLHLGASKRHRKDTLKLSAGIAIATRRALQNYLSSRYLV